jgi:hypothetical protein
LFGLEGALSSSKGSVVNYLRSFSCCVFVLSFVPSFARADEPSLVEWTQRRVEAALLKPLAERTSRFSRSRPPPHESRVRVTQTALSRDKQGRDFVPFSVDVRYGTGDWRADDMVGCAYRGSGNLFIKSGKQYFPAALLLGKRVEAVTGVCQAAPAART